MSTEPTVSVPVIESDGPTFSSRGLRPTIVAALEKKGYTTPTPIQALTFKHFTEGHHIVGESQTGSGKTAAFLLPLLNVINLKEAAPQVLVLAPTRELALQTEEEAFELTRGLFGAKTALICGGLSFKNQIQRIKFGANVIIGTPGRILSMIEKQILQTNQIQYLVLDEVDRMLDMGFIDEVEAIWSKLPKHLRALCFSATMPYEVKALFNRYLPEGYQHIQIEKKQIVVDELDHCFVRIPEMKKLEFLESYLTKNEFQKILIFAQTKKSVDELQHILHVEGYDVLGLHGDVDQYERINAMKAVKASKKVILVATDVASRGLNLNDVDLVVNFDMPQDPEDYVHRVGRTARAGQLGKAIMFVTPSEDRKLTQLEKSNKIHIKEVDVEGNAVHRQVEQQCGSYRGGGGRRRQPRPGGNQRFSGNTRSSGGRFGGSDRRTYTPHPSSSSRFPDRPSSPARTSDRYASGERSRTDSNDRFASSPSGGERRFPERTYTPRPQGDRFAQRSSGRGDGQSGTRPTSPQRGSYGNRSTANTRRPGRETYRSTNADR